MGLADINFPVRYDESMNTVLTQELIRFNNLTSRLKKTLKEVQKALKGQVVMSAELEAMGNSMVNGAVPAIWTAVSYPSRKGLGPWTTDFLGRLVFLQDWMDSKTTPVKYWISGFFFTQAFITGTKQNFARKHRLPIDECIFDFEVLAPSAKEEMHRGPEDGAYMWGLFIDGARWDSDLHALAEQNPKELYSDIPMMLLKPSHKSKVEPVRDTDANGTAHIYMCPTYKTSARFGVLMTTGHSTNFVMWIRLPMQKCHRQKHWIKRGLAMLSQLDD